MGSGSAMKINNRGQKIKSASKKLIRTSYLAKSYGTAGNIKNFSANVPNNYDNQDVKMMFNKRQSDIANFL